MIKVWRTVVFYTVLCCLLKRSASAAGNEQDARKIFSEMAENLRSRQEFRVNMTVSTSMEAKGQKRETVTKCLFALKRPDKVAQILEEGEMGLTIVCDGEKVYTYFPMMRTYTVAPAPDSLERLAGNLSLAMGDAIPIAGALISDDPGQVLLEKVTQITHAGVDTAGGVDCHRLHFEQDDLDWDAWISADDKRLLMKVVPDFSKIMAKAREERNAGAPRDSKYDMIVTLSNWMTEGDLPEDQFVFTPAEKSIQVDSFFPKKVPAEGARNEGQESR